MRVSTHSLHAISSQHFKLMGSLFLRLKNCLQTVHYRFEDFSILYIKQNKFYYLVLSNEESGVLFTDEAKEMLAAELILDVDTLT